MRAITHFHQLHICEILNSLSSKSICVHSGGFKTMSSPPQTLNQLQDRVIVSNVEALRAVIDPVYARILVALEAGPLSAIELAAAVGLPLDRIRTHIDMIEAYSLVEKLPVSDDRSPLDDEPFVYHLHAPHFALDRNLFAPDAPTREIALKTLVDVILRKAVEEIEQSVRAGLIDLQMEPPAAQALMLHRRFHKLTPLRAVWLQERLQRLMEEVARASQEDPGEKQDVAFCLAVYPILFPQGEHDETAGAV
jgi:hypothetical protein